MNLWFEAWGLRKVPEGQDKVNYCKSMLKHKDHNSKSLSENIFVYGLIIIDDCMAVLQRNNFQFT